jgi:hypothetical protein
MNWAGNDKVGEGKLTIVESRPNELVKVKVDFVEPFEGTNTSEFQFKPETAKTASKPSLVIGLTGQSHALRAQHGGAPAMLLR